jgi:hypothetical protein
MDSLVDGGGLQSEYGVPLRAASRIGNFSQQKQFGRANKILLRRILGPRNQFGGTSMVTGTFMDQLLWNSAPTPLNVATWNFFSKIDFRFDFFESSNAKEPSAWIFWNSSNFVDYVVFGFDFIGSPAFGNGLDFGLRFSPCFCSQPVRIRRIAVHDWTCL